MAASWSQLEGCFRFDCIYGCQGTDYESHWEAERAEGSHDCQFPGVPRTVRLLKDGMS